MGFWDYKNYKNLENIVFIKENNIDLWVDQIKKLYTDNEKLEELSNNSLNLIKNEYKLSKFDTELEKYLVK